jgi:hypothetical protein
MNIYVDWRSAVTRHQMIGEPAIAVATGGGVGLNQRRPSVAFRF